MTDVGDVWQACVTPNDGGVVESCGDHRIAMAAGVAATGTRGPVNIAGAEAAAVSWPDFYETLEAVWSSR